MDKESGGSSGHLAWGHLSWLSGMSKVTLLLMQGQQTGSAWLESLTGWLEERLQGDFRSLSLAWVVRRAVLSEARAAGEVQWQGWDVSVLLWYCFCPGDGQLSHTYSCLEIHCYLSSGLGVTEWHFNHLISQHSQKIQEVICSVTQLICRRTGFPVDSNKVFALCSMRSCFWLRKFEFLKWLHLSLYAKCHSL